jgi:uncharacterized protein
MRTRVKRWTVLAIGWMFILLGIAGLFLPVLQGILFLVIGLLILSTEYVWAHHLVRKLLNRFPRVEESIARAPDWIKKFIPHHMHQQGATRETRNEERQTVQR